MRLVSFVLGVGVVVDALLFYDADGFGGSGVDAAQTCLV